jgi:hypothetical protein
MPKAKGQIGWDFGPTVMEGHTTTRRAQSPSQQRAMIAFKAAKVAVAGQRSQLSDMDFAGAYCTRCGHACSGRHHPGAAGRCAALNCNCQMSVVACECRHDSADHEPCGAEVGTACQHCDCAVFTIPRS